ACGGQFGLDMLELLGSPFASTGMTTPDSAKAPLSSYHRWVLFFLGVAGFFDGYDTYAYSQILPTLQAETSLSTAATGWVTGLPQIGEIAALLLVRSADRWGRRAILNVTIVGYAIGTVLTGLSPNIWTFVVSQTLAHFFLVGEWSVATVYAAEEFP